MVNSNIATTFRELVSSDMERIGLPNKAWLGIIYRLLVSPNFLTSFLYRLGFYFGSKKHTRFLAFITWRLNLYLTACDISPFAEIGAGLAFEHPTGTVIGAGVRIGRNATIFQHVTLGLASTGKDHYAQANYPNIGDGVTMYAGAVIVGPVQIGSGAIIGANSVVLCDVPRNCTAVGIPARIIKPEPVIRAV